MDVTDVVEKEQRAAIEVVDLEDDTIDHSVVAAGTGPKTPAATAPAATPSRTRVEMPVLAAVQELSIHIELAASSARYSSTVNL